MFPHFLSTILYILSSKPFSEACDTMGNVYIGNQYYTCLYMTSDSNCCTCYLDFYHLVQCSSCTLYSQLYYFGRSVRCMPCPEFCATCSSSPVCTLCYDGYYLMDTSFSCAKCSNKFQNCRTCTETYCKTCLDNTYALSFDFLKCEKCYSIAGLPYCKTCLSQGECTSCQSDLYV